MMVEFDNPVRILARVVLGFLFNIMFWYIGVWIYYIVFSLGMVFGMVIDDKRLLYDYWYDVVLAVFSWPGTLIVNVLWGDE